MIFRWTIARGGTQCRFGKRGIQTHQRASKGYHIHCGSVGAGGDRREGDHRRDVQDERGGWRSGDLQRRAHRQVASGILGLVEKKARVDHIQSRSGGGNGDLCTEEIQLQRVQGMPNSRAHTLFVELVDTSKGSQLQEKNGGQIVVGELFQLIVHHVRKEME